MNLGQVYTKPSVARYMTGLLTLPDGARVLDPCFGRGAFIDALTAMGRYAVDGVEIDAESYAACLDRESATCRLHHADFFSFDARARYLRFIVSTIPTGTPATSTPARRESLSRGSTTAPALRRSSD